MPAKALTARLVDTAREPGKYFDGNGLFLRVLPNGSRQWVQRLMVRGRRRELGLGSPPTVPLGLARELALANRRVAQSGGDPLRDKRQAAAALTFADAVERYLEARLSEFRNEKHRKQWRSTLDTYAVPVLGRLLVKDVAVADVLRVLEPIWVKKTETASRLRGRIESVLAWATAGGHRVGDNPGRWRGNLAEMLPKPGKIGKNANQPALALSDAARFWSALADREGMAARALQFLALTAARSGEVRGMAWAELDLSNRAKAIWTVPAARMKMKREHRVPLTAEAVALLQNLPRLDKSPLVFFAPQGGQLSDMTLSAVMRRIHAAELKAERTGFVDPRSKRPAVPHGLRSTFRQWAAEQGYDRDMAELALAHHVGTETERAYQRSDMLERRRAMLEAWGRFLRGETGAKVVPLDRKRA